jgi:hypothetical protein
MHSIYYTPNMGRQHLVSCERLELMRSSAFESEHAWQYDISYMEHEAAAAALELEIEQSLASISPDENSDEQIRIIKTQITVHRERQRALRPHLESGSDRVDEYGNDCVFVPAPNHWGANGDLDEESESLSSVRCMPCSLFCDTCLPSQGPKSAELASLILTSVPHIL